MLTRAWRASGASARVGKPQMLGFKRTLRAARSGSAIRAPKLTPSAVGARRLMSLARALEARRAAGRTGARAFSSTVDLTALEDNFKRTVEEHLPADGKGVVFTTAWLVSDNVIVAMLREHFPEVLEGMHLAAVDTMHLFPETHEVAAEVQARYNKEAVVFNPLGVTDRAGFEQKYGHCEDLSHADFDLHSKVEPFQRALRELEKDILITGRRMDQGEARVDLAAWEPDARTCNPIADWSWDAVLAYVDKNGVPYNRAHEYVFRTEAFIPATERHRDDLPWKKAELGKPFWQATEAEIRGDLSEAGHAFVYKSFGDIHTTVPVYSHESERTGRFVRYDNSECGIHTRVAQPGAPHGGKGLTGSVVDDAVERERLIASTQGKPLELSERQACDVELLMTGAFSPLEGFMTRATYDSVVEKMRLPEQQLWGMPVVLDSDRDDIVVGQDILLRHDGEPVAVLHVSDVWEADKVKESKHVFGTTSAEHPGVLETLTSGKKYLGGSVTGLQTPTRNWVAKTPREVREELGVEVTNAGHVPPVVAFQCRNPIHRAHYELVRAALNDPTLPFSRVLIHPTCGPTQPGDIDGETRIKTYEALAEEVSEDNVTWAYLPYSMKMAGPREAIQHMIIRKNFGATHFIVGRDMAGTKSTLTGEDFYGEFEAQEFAKDHADELGIQVLAYENIVHTAERGFLPESEVKDSGLTLSKLSGTEFRRLLRAGEPIPEWFAFESVINVLRDDVAADSAPAKKADDKKSAATSEGDRATTATRATA